MNELFRGWLLDRLALDESGSSELDGSNGLKKDLRTSGGRRRSDGDGDDGLERRREPLRGIVPMDYYDTGGVVDVMLVYDVIRRG